MNRSRYPNHSQIYEMLEKWAKTTKMVSKDSSTVAYSTHKVAGTVGKESYNYIDNKCVVFNKLNVCRIACPFLVILVPPSPCY